MRQEVEEDLLVLAAVGEDHVYEAQPVLTASVTVAVEAAERWLKESDKDE